MKSGYLDIILAHGIFWDEKKNDFQIFTSKLISLFFFACI